MCVGVYSNVCICVCFIPLLWLNKLETKTATTAHFHVIWFNRIPVISISLIHSSSLIHAREYCFLSVNDDYLTLNLISSCSSSQAAARGVSLSSRAGPDSSAVRSYSLYFSWFFTVHPLKVPYHKHFHVFSFSSRTAVEQLHIIIIRQNTTC